jgi:hypothetical protein
MAIAMLGAPALAQDAPKPIDRTLTINVLETGCDALGGKDPCWDTKTLVAAPGDNVTLVADLRGSTNAHNLHAKAVKGAPALSNGDAGTKVAPAAMHNITFTMPEGTTGVTVVCDVHGTMTLSILPPAVAAKAGGGTDAIPKLGVNFLSYWVGVIAFALLFITYGLTFFLFKYNETPATTDQWDRTGSEGIESKRRFSSGTASILAILLAVVVIAGIVYVARLA